MNSIYESLFSFLKPNTPSLLDDLTGETRQAVKEALGLSRQTSTPGDSSASSWPS